MCVGILFCSATVVFEHYMIENIDLYLYVLILFCFLLFVLLLLFFPLSLIRELLRFPLMLKKKRKKKKKSISFILFILFFFPAKFSVIITMD